MMQITFKKRLEQMMEAHIPAAFLDYEFWIQIKHLLLKRDTFGRKEILILAYLIGVNTKECNELLCLLGYPTLYVKRREDAIWQFALNHRMDSATVMEEIFLQNVDEMESVDR